MIFQKKTWWSVFFLNFLYVRWELQNSVKTTFQKSQTLEQIIKYIPGRGTVYHDQQKSKKSRRQ